LNYDPDFREGQLCMKMIKKTAAMKEEATELFKAGDYKNAITKY